MSAEASCKKRQPVFGLFVPTDLDTASFFANHPNVLSTTQRRDGKLFSPGTGQSHHFRFISTTAMFDMREIPLLFDKLMDILVIVALIRTQMLF
jgi:hypothetical protein